MSKRYLICMAALVAAMLTPMIVSAQEEEAPKPYVYATYFYCNTADQWLADGIVKNAWAPVYDAAVGDGTISAWGWMAHHTGGKWRRLSYRVAPTLDALLDGGDAISAKIAESNPEVGSKFGEICSAHDDYIWQQVTGSGVVGQERGSAGFSVYLVCDMAKEERADEIVKEILGPVYDKHVAAGKLTTWGWMRHIVGGKYRRIATMTAADHKSLLAARAEILGEIGEKHEAAGNEFNSICSSHQDYMWEVQLEKP